MTKQATKPVAASKTKPVAAKPVAATKPQVAAKAVAAKPVVAKVAAPAKSAPVKVTHTATATVSKMKDVVKSFHILTDIARPQSGPRLFAHTVAAMTVLGMFGKDRPAVMRSALQSFIGATAIRYHVKTKGSLVEQGDKVRLTEPGVGFFKSRKFDKDEQAGFEKLFKTGDGSAVKVRPAHIVPVSLSV